MESLQTLLMRWLNSLRNYLRINRGKGQVTKSEGYALSPNDMVSRFIYSSSAFSKQHSRVKPGAFNPEPHPKLSVLHSTGLCDKEVWKCGQQTLGTQRGRTKIHCRADLAVEKFIAKKLQAIRDDDPFERHTSVVGWPRNADPDQQKAEIKAICLELSQDPEIRVVLPVAPITKDSSII
jgi:hypothetical protein